jgi:hypothetical protein
MLIYIKNFERGKGLNHFEIFRSQKNFEIIEPINHPALNHMGCDITGSALVFICQLFHLQVWEW